MSWLTIGVWACALIASLCTAVVSFFAMENRRSMIAAMQMLKGMNATQMQAIEILTIDLDRLKQRVTDIETDIL